MDQYSPLDDGGPVQGKLPLGDDPEAERSALADLLDSSRLYHKSRDYLELLDFVARLRDYAPFNAMLLHVQKPGLTYAATARDWQVRFRRIIKEGARPLLILRPFAPVAFVYDVLDTEGPDLPADVAQAFRAIGPITDAAIRCHIERLRVMGIYVERLPSGDGNAGLIRAVKPSTDRKEKPDYQVRVNATHDLNVQFVTLVHELGHLFLGHLGPDAYLRIAQRVYPSDSGSWRPSPWPIWCASDAGSRPSPRAILRTMLRPIPRSMPWTWIPCSRPPVRWRRASASPPRPRSGRCPSRDRSSGARRTS